MGASLNRRCASSKKKHELGLVRIADLGQFLEQLRQQPQQERRVEPRVLHQLVGGEDVDVAAPVAVGADEVLERERRLAEEIVAALVLQHQKLTLNGADRRLRDVAVLHRQLGGVLGQVAEHGAQVLEIEQQQPLLVGDAEADVEHALLDVVEVHQPRQQQRPHLRDGGAHRMALLAEQVPEDDRKLVGLVGEAEALGARDEGFLGLARLGHARQIALDVGGEHRHAGARQPFRQHLQRDGLAGAGRAGHEAVAVGQRQRQELGLVALADEDFAVRIDVCHRMLSFSARSESRMYCRFPATTVNTATEAYAEEEIYCSLGFPNANVAVPAALAPPIRRGRAPRDRIAGCPAAVRTADRRAFCNRPPRRR